MHARCSTGAECFHGAPAHRLLGHPNGGARQSSATSSFTVDLLVPERPTQTRNRTSRRDSASSKPATLRNIDTFADVLCPVMEGYPVGDWRMASINDATSSLPRRLLRIPASLKGPTST